MKICQEVLQIPKSVCWNGEQLRDYIAKHQTTAPESKAIRFIIVGEQGDSYACEIDFVIYSNKEESKYFDNSQNIFSRRTRSCENTDKFTAALLIPTGIGAELGGHCGDGNTAARLLATACDTLITHPNVVNASDLNEMLPNTLYVEGGAITDLFNGSIGLKTRRNNRILMLMDTSDDVFFNNEIVNAVSSARVTLGIDCDVLKMSTMIESSLNYTKSGRAAAEIDHFERLLDIIDTHKSDYDAFGLATIVQIPEEDSKAYFESSEESVNPWGGSEAIITHSVGAAFGKATAHSPLSLSMGDLHLEYDMGIVDPRKAPESTSVAYLHCILKGLHKAPQIVQPNEGTSLEDISCLIIPDGCIGLPVLAALENNIPVIAVKNSNIMKNNLHELPFRKNQLFFAENYLEAAGIMTALQAGISVDTVLRPIRHTEIL